MIDCELYHICTLRRKINLEMRGADDGTLKTIAGIWQVKALTEDKGFDVANGIRNGLDKTKGGVVPNPWWIV